MEFLDKYYYHQGYSLNGRGSCLASSILMTARMVRENNLLLMKNISMWTNCLQLLNFSEPGVTVLPFASAMCSLGMILPNNRITGIITDSQETIATNSRGINRNTNLVRSNSALLTLPLSSNFGVIFNVSKSMQVEKIYENLIKDGCCIVQIDNVASAASSLHYVLVSEIDSQGGRIRIIDPSPGFRQMKKFGVSKIVEGTITNIKMLTDISAKYHPKGSFEYWVDLKYFESIYRSRAILIN